MAFHRTRFYRFVSLFLCCMMILTWSSVTMAFYDTEGHWAEEAIRQWSEEYGIFISPDGRFRPAEEITRAELAVLLDRMFCYTEYAETNFMDVPADAPYADAISKLNAAGILLGDGIYASPMETVTREQAVTLLVRAFAMDMTKAGNEAEQYADAAQISDWAKDAVSLMTAFGYIQGSEGRFQPGATITRAEMVTIFDNIFAAMYSTGGVYREFIDGSVIVNADHAVVLRDMTICGDLFIAHNVTAPLTLDDVLVLGEIRNFSGVDLIRVGSQDEPTPPQDFISYSSKAIPVLQDVPRNSYRDERFYLDENGYMQYDSAHYETLTGIDVSAWQGEIDWTLVAQQEIDYVLIRVGNRGYTEGGLNLDEYFYRNIEGALSVGLPVGVYFFSQAISAEEAREEAQFTLDAIEGYDISFPVVFDWEPVSSDTARTNGLSTQTLCDAANAFCEVIEEAGYQPMIYGNLHTAYLKYDLSQLLNFDFWLAQYANVPSFYYDFQMWQYTSDGTVQGIKGGVDMNICFVNYQNRG